MCIVEMCTLLFAIFAHKFSINYMWTRHPPRIQLALIKALAPLNQKFSQSLFVQREKRNFNYSSTCRANPLEYEFFFFLYANKKNERKRGEEMNIAKRIEWMLLCTGAEYKIVRYMDLGALYSTIPHLACTFRVNQSPHFPFRSPLSTLYCMTKEKHLFLYIL